MTIVLQFREKLRDTPTEMALARVARRGDRGARSSRSPDVHGAWNTVLSALVVHDECRDSKKRCATTPANTFKPGPLNEVKEPAEHVLL